MKTKNLFLMAAMLLMSVCLFAQSKYLYIGPEEPTAENYKTLATEVTSYDDCYEYENNTGQRCNVYVLVAEDISVSGRDPALGWHARVTTLEFTSADIPGHKVFRTVGTAIGGRIIFDLGDEWKHFYLGTTQPTADNYEALTPAFSSLPAMDGATVQVPSSGKIYLLVPYSNSPSQSLLKHCFINNEGKTVTYTGRNYDGTSIFRHYIWELSFEPGTVLNYNYLTDGFNNQTLYTLTCKRGALVMNAEGTGLAAGQTRTDAPEEDKRFAIITYNGKRYLYSPTSKQYLLADGSFVSRLGSPITFDDSKADGEYKFILSTPGTNGETWYFNNNGNIVINSWGTPDDGNRWLIESSVVNIDLSEALAMAATQTYMVTYEVLYEGKIVATATEEVASGSALPAPPASLKNDYITLTKSGTHPTKVTQDVTVKFTAKWNGPFEFSKNVTTAKWYNMHIRSGWYVGKQDSEPYYPTTDAGDLLRTKAYHWAFGGNPYHVKVYNRTTDFAETLAKDGDNAVMRSGEYAWDILPNNGGFVLREIETDYNCINQYGGAGGPLKFWNDGNSPTDDGSTFRVEEAQPLLDGIEFVAETAENADIYDLSGRKQTKLQRGVYILRRKDGTTRTVLVK